MNQIKLFRPTLQLIGQRWRHNEAKEDLQLVKLNMRRVPYVRKGTKAEKKPPIKYRRIIFDQIQDQMAASGLEMKPANGDWVNGDYSIEVKTKGDDAFDYTGMNWIKDPTFMSRTVVVDDPSDPQSIAVAYTQLNSYLRREGLNAYHGGAYRFRERPQDTRRRLAYFEAKRIVSNELERKKAYLSANFVETGRNDFDPIIKFNPEYGSKAVGTGAGRMLKPPTRRERAEQLYETLKSKSKADQEKSARDAFLDDLL